MPINKDYIASKIFQNKSGLESKHDIANNIEQYVGVNENILLDTHATLQQAIKNNLCKIKPNGKTETIGAKRERKKAQMKSTPKTLWLLPLIGWIVYAALYGSRKGSFNDVKKEERRQLQQALINALETNPMFLKTAEQYVANITDKEERKLYEKCLNIAQQHLSEANEGKYDKIIDETVDYLQTEQAVNMDKQVLKEMYNNNTPESLQKQIQESLNTKKLSFSLDQRYNNSQLLKKVEAAKKKGFSITNDK